MCGIVGAIWTDPTREITPSIRSRMLSVLRHRGPDDHGEHAWTGSPISGWLGHRRLSIIDLSAAGRQPLSNGDGTLWITFNGEIYNYRELREELLSQGHRFRTETDTEVIVHLYERDGIECLSRLRGMFAFAIWDARKRQLYLARDRMGQKPLFYADQHFGPDSPSGSATGRVVFASELKAILELPDLDRAVNEEALNNYLTYMYVPHPQSILRGVRKLPPGHYAIVSASGVTTAPYWQPPYNDPITDRDATWWRNSVRETLTEAVRLRLRSDVPLGTFLSGGLDSTIITGLTQSLTERQVQSFSIGFPVARFDERSFARTAAEHLGTDHHERIVEPSAVDAISELVWQYDEPFADSSAIPTLALSKMTRERVTVALSGDAADELFGGYERYRAVELAAMSDRLPSPVRKLLTASIWQRIPASVEQRTWRRRFKRFLQGLALPPEDRYLRWITQLDADRRAWLYTEGFRNRLGEHDPRSWIRDAYRTVPDRDLLTRTMAVDVATYLPGDILTKVDIASMTASLEARSPFLDHHVVELAARMPVQFKMRRGIGKKILREVFADLIPPSIDKRSKMGFGVPIDVWFRNELKPLLYDVLLDSRTLARGHFREEALRELIDDHITERADRSYLLWMLLVLEQWFRTHVDRNG